MVIWSNLPAQGHPRAHGTNRTVSTRSLSTAAEGHSTSSGQPVPLPCNRGNPDNTFSKEQNKQISNLEGQKNPPQLTALPAASTFYTSGVPVVE